MARIIDENLEGTGYEETWTEVVDTGCTLDEDAAIPGTPPTGAGSQCLKAITLNATNDLAYAQQILTNMNIAYIRFYIYCDQEGLANDNLLRTTYILNSAGTTVCGVYLTQTSGVLYLKFIYYSGGAFVTAPASFTFSLNTHYRIEYRYDVANMLWEWRVDGITQDSGSLTSATRIPNRLRTGIWFNNGGAQSTLYTDLVVWDDANWVGAESEKPSIIRKIRGRGISR